MRLLISAGANKTIEDVNGHSWIHYAVRGDCTKEVLQSIIDLGADVNARNKKNCTALMLASKNGNVDAMNVLVGAGADQGIEDDNGCSWIHYHFDGDCRKEVFESMINLGACVNATNKKNTTPLMMASRKGNVDAMNVFLNAGADPAIEDANGYSWIHYAIFEGCSKEVLQSVIDLGADVNVTSKQNCSALMLASKKGNEDAINVLLGAGADQANEDVNGDSWIHYFVRGDCNKDVLRLIIQLGANVNAKNKMNCTALMLASKKGNEDAMNVLLSAGADQANEDVNGDSLIHYAIDGDCSKEVLQSVIELGADVNATNKQNVTALMLASNKGNIDAMNVLISAGANKTMEDANGESWIHYAVRGDCREEILKSIIELGADVNTRNRQNCTALMLTSKKGNTNAMNVLINAISDRIIEDANDEIWISCAANRCCSEDVLKSVILLVVTSVVIIIVIPFLSGP